MLKNCEETEIKVILVLKILISELFFSPHMALIVFCKRLMMQNRSHVFLIVIGYDNNVKGIHLSQLVLSFVYFSPPPCLYHYERVSTKSC